MSEHNNDYLKYSFDEFISKFKLFKDVESIIKDYAQFNPDIVSDFDLDYLYLQLLYEKFTKISKEINTEIDSTRFVNCMNIAFQSKGRIEALSWMLLANNIQLKSIERFYPVTDSNQYYYKDGNSYVELPTKDNKPYFSDHMEIYSDNSGINKIDNPYYTLYRSNAILGSKSDLPWITLKALELRSVELSRLNDAIKECAPYLIWDKYNDIGTEIENVIIELKFEFETTVVGRAYATLIMGAVEEV